MSTKRIAVLGAGWYGCHIANSLLQKGCAVDVFEREKDIFSQASSNNQNRLHLGFHYPRSYVTRHQSRVGYDKFMQIYGSLVREVPSNVYAVDNSRSLLDFETYKQIMAASGLAYREVEYPRSYFENLDGFIETDEKVIDHFRAKEYFKSTLQSSIRLSTNIAQEEVNNFSDFVMVGDEKFDYLIDCSWGTASKCKQLDYYYEPCITLLYESSLQRTFGLTIMDGNFVSLYPYVNNLYTLTSVQNTPLGKTATFEDAKKMRDHLNGDRISKLISAFEKEIIYYYPDFLDCFRYSGFYLSIKTKLNERSDSRQAMVIKNNREVFVMSGKIDAVFHAEQIIADYVLGRSL